MSSLLKSVFTAAYPVFCLVVFSYMLSDLLGSEFSWNHLGIVISSGAGMLYFVLLFLLNKTSTDKFIQLYSWPIILGTALAITALFIEEFELIHLIFTLCVALGWLAYLFWSSAFYDRDENKILQIGNELPNLIFESEKKEKVSSSSFHGKFAIYIFYRGNWCPFCTAQVEEVIKEQKELEKRGVSTIFVSPQPHKYTSKLGRNRGGDFHFLVDVKNKVSRQLEIFCKNGLPASFQVFGFDSDTVLPTVIITNAIGKIIYTDQTENYRIRPEPADFVKVIDKYNSEK